MCLLQSLLCRLICSIIMGIWWSVRHLRSHVSYQKNFILLATFPILVMSRGPNLDMCSFLYMINWYFPGLWYSMECLCAFGWPIFIEDLWLLDLLEEHDLFLSWWTIYLVRGFLCVNHGFQFRVESGFREGCWLSRDSSSIIIVILAF